MFVYVAGAGAGKTTNMADVLSRQSVPKGMVIYCIAFTNAAVDNVKSRVMDKLGTSSANIKIMTIHSFLYNEIVKPYYSILFGVQYKKISAINLPKNPKYKALKLNELEKEKYLHYTKIPERAKWVVYKKSGDNKIRNTLRKRIVTEFKKYCAAIYVDEAQDINKDIYEILCALDSYGIAITLYGDPKQDIKGYGYFRKIVDKTKDVIYLPVCHRCPQIHLDMSNLFAVDDEKQYADESNQKGCVSVFFEYDMHDIQQFICNENYGLIYISKKNKRFETHNKSENNKRRNSLFHEVKQIMTSKWRSQKDEFAISRAAYYVTEKMFSIYKKSRNVQFSINLWVRNGTFDILTKKEYARMCELLSQETDERDNKITVQSIEAVKGLESEKCLFILTKDLADYLLGNKVAENKMTHLLYVALTRSKDNLTILVTKEVEERYGREIIGKLL